MITYFNVVFVFVCFVILIQYVERLLRRLTSIPLILTDVNMQDVIETANRISPRWRDRFRNAQILIVVVITMMVFMGLCYPFLSDTGEFHQNWPDFVLRLSSWMVVGQFEI